DLRACDSPEAPPHAQEFPPTPEPVEFKLRRRLKKKGLEIAGQLLQFVVNAHESFGIFDRNLAQLRDRAIAISPPRHHLAVEERHLQHRITRNHAQSMRRQ